MIVFMYLNYVEHGVAFMSKYELSKKMVAKRKIKLIQSHYMAPFIAWSRAQINQNSTRLEWLNFEPSVALNQQRAKCFAIIAIFVDHTDVNGINVFMI